MPVSTNGEVILMKHTKDEGANKKSKPSPFYLSLIIKDRILHHFLIDSGAGSSIMPTCVAHQLGIKYESMIKHVL